MENLKIYIDRLRTGSTLKIDETLPSDFLNVNEKELTFDAPVHIKGEIYIANEELIMHLNISTSVRLPCSICNNPVSTPIVIKNLYTIVPLTEIKGAIYDITGEIRESILLQIPLFTECNNGKCPERENLNKFLKPSKPPSKTNTSSNFPFADLDFD